ncbi:hypothetical protein MSIMFI_04649 [Mycobacterium simulans]|nr:hypothetical protein MSIMFI_04649 [Mycobacterium simulans]
MFENTSDSKSERFAATRAGLTIADRTASNSAAMAPACAAAWPARAAAVASHSTYGPAAAAIATDDAPCHDPFTSPDVTVPKEAAAEPNSSANPPQAAAASSIGSDPAPASIRAELTSGGKTEKFITATLLRWDHVQI